MAGVKRLRSVAQSLAHHAMSGSCPEAPARAIEQRRAGLERITVGLLAEPGVPASWLQQKFSDLLRKEDVVPGLVMAATATFLFRGQCREADACIVSLATRDGRTIEAKV